MHESPEWKPDWLGYKRLLTVTYLYIAMQLICSNILLQTGR